MRRQMIVVIATLACAVPAGARQVVVDTFHVAMHDGVRLETVVHRPAAAGAHPTVLVRTPYARRSTDWLSERLAPHGYAVAVQTVRGVEGSEGAFVPFVFDASDGATTLDWVLEQPWSGQVGLWGISYLSWAAYAVAETGHPGISAMFLGSGWAELEPFFAPGGAFHLMAHVPWLIFMSGDGRLPPPPVLDQIFRTVPLSQFFQGMEEVGAAADAPFRWEALDVPALHMTGWHDYIYPHSLAGYDRMRAGPRAGEAQRLIVGPWAHNDELHGTTRVGDVDFGPAAESNADSVAAWTRRFFDAHLRGLAVDEPPARVFVMGENRWRTFDGWPPPVAERVVWHLSDRGLDTIPAAAARSHGFVYDPNDPMPTLGGANSNFLPENLGPLDQRPLDGREDVARWLSEPLGGPLILAGPIRATLHVEADAPSTDVAARLVAVLPDGTARLVEDGIRRIADLGPGVHEITVDMGQRALRLEAGTRLRLDVSGGNFPKYDRNPNTGEDPIEATAFRPVRIAIHEGPGRPSTLELFALPAVPEP